MTWWQLMKRMAMLVAFHGAACMQDWAGMLLEYETEREIRKASDPAIKAAWQKVSTYQQRHSMAEVPGADEPPPKA